MTSDLKGKTCVSSEGRGRLGWTVTALLKNSLDKIREKITSSSLQEGDFSSHMTLTMEGTFCVTIFYAL